MKLLSKEDTQKLKTLERKMDIDEGLKIARKIDQLRKDYSNEETKLKRFKEENEKEVDLLIQKRDLLIEEIESLKAEKNSITNH